MLAEGVRKIAGVADLDTELDLGELECDIIYKRFSIVANCPWCLCRTSGGRNDPVQSRQGRTIFTGLTPPGLCDDMRYRVQFEGAVSNPYRVVVVVSHIQ